MSFRINVLLWWIYECLWYFIDCHYYAISSIFSFCLQIFRTLQHKFLSRRDHIIIWQVVSGERKEVVLKTDFLSSSVQMDVWGVGCGHQLKSGNAIGGFCHHEATGKGSVMPPLSFRWSSMMSLFGCIPSKCLMWSSSHGRILEELRLSASDQRTNHNHFFQASALLILVLPKPAVSPRRPLWVGSAAHEQKPR